MSEKPQGGPAFPCVIGDIYYKGMTLRDYFAAKVLASLVVALVVNPATIGAGVTITQRAYELADAMIAAREQ